MPQRILFVLNPFLGWRTYGRQLARVIEGRTDIEPMVLTLRIPSWQRLVLKRHVRGGASDLVRRVDPIAAYQGWLGRSIRDAVDRFRPRAIHFAPHFPAAAAMALPRAVPFTAVLDCTRPGMARFLGRAAWSAADMDREAHLLRSAARLYSMSRWTTDSIVGDCGVPADRVTTMPPSIDLSGFGAPSRMGGLPKVLFIGNDFRRKGGDRLAHWIGGPLAGTCELHVVSEDPDARADGPHVVNHGRVDHARLIGDLMPRMDVFCLPTRSDMSPHVLSEAAAAGLPSVASDLGGIPDLVDHGTTGFLVPPHDDDAFVGRLRDLVTSADLRSRMSVAASHKAMAEFDAAVNYNRLIDDLIGISGG